MVNPHTELSRRQRIVLRLMATRTRLIAALLELEDQIHSAGIALPRKSKADNKAAGKRSRRP